MEHQDHVRLLRDGIPGPGGVWADFGSGRGAFTLALADLLGPTAVIYSVDRDQRALRDQEAAMRAQFPATTVHHLAADYREPLSLPPLDGVVLANTLHFHRIKAPVLARLCGYLRSGGALLLVEYNSDRGNPWVPFPLSYSTWERLASDVGLAGTRLLATRRSRFMGEIYAAASVVG